LTLGKSRQACHSCHRRLRQNTHQHHKSHAISDKPNMPSQSSFLSSCFLSRFLIVLNYPVLLQRCYDLLLFLLRLLQIHENPNPIHLLSVHWHWMKIPCRDHQYRHRGIRKCYAVFCLNQMSKMSRLGFHYGIVSGSSRVSCRIVVMVSTRRGSADSYSQVQRMRRNQFRGLRPAARCIELW
jgi:hypothetical protein